MQISDAQIRQFDEEGYLFLPGLFGAGEVAAMKAEIPAIFAARRQENVREKTGAGEAVRTAFAVHTYNEVFRRLVRHPRILGPGTQLLGGELYVHQFKLNAKAAFDGDVWQWHQDYGTWKRDDDMPEAKAMNLAVFLDEVNEFNAPLMFIPRSHKLGVLEAGHDVTTTSYPLWTLDHATVRKLVDQGGIVAPKGPPGCGLFFHGTLVHASTANLSPWDRLIVYVSYNRVSNAIRRFQRPAWIAHRDFAPLEPLADDCLLTVGNPKAAE
jgi:ectoine hydroxylase